jgi:hypothetical protein
MKGAMATNRRGAMLSSWHRVLMVRMLPPPENR